MEPGKQQKGGAGNLQNNPFMSRGMVAGVAAVIVIVVLLAALLIGSSSNNQIITPQVCGQKAIAYVNNNLVPQGSSAEMGSVQETNGVYEITTRYRGSVISLYATKDCQVLFTNAIRIGSLSDCNTATGNCIPSSAESTATQVAPVKSARPSVELYVMSFCPYGVQAENAFKPVADLLGTTADIRVRYIATVQGDSISSVQSLHGNAEATEDIRQLCLAKYAPEKYWDYLAAFNARCYPVWNDPARLSQCTENVTATLGIPMKAVDQCLSGNEGLGLLRTDEARTISTGSTSSPTLIINGQRYSGPRTPEAFKQAVCSHFDTQPKACDTVLTSQAAGVSGSC
jgi:glutaredoxin